VGREKDQDMQEDEDDDNNNNGVDWFSLLWLLMTLHCVAVVVVVESIVRAKGNNSCLLVPPEL
jgi:hypothetical protein